jgi:hypothetical protein
MANTMVFAVEPLGINTVELPKGTAKVRAGGFNHQVIVVIH